MSNNNWKGYRILFFLTLITNTTLLPAQTNLPVAGKNNRLHLKSTPFSSVQVLDNRVDTVKIELLRNGRYPFLYTRLFPSCAVAVQQYLQQRIEQLPKGDRKLLINILQLKVPGVTTVARRNAKGNKTKVRDLRGHYVFIAEVFEEAANGTYIKRMAVDKDYSIAYSITDILNELLIAASDTARPDTDNGVYTFQQINRNTVQRWQQYPILADSAKIQDGCYASLDDFRENKVTQKGPRLFYDETDSSWYNSGSLNGKWPWAFAEKGKLYVFFSNDIYLPMVKEGGSFSFTIPYSFKNMHTRLALNALKENVAYFNPPNTGNLLLDLVGAVAGAAVVGALTAAPALTRAGVLTDESRHQFRKCFIDLNCGDFIYDTDTYFHF